MIFLDANAFLRYLAEPATPDIERFHDLASALFAAIERGDELATTSEAVLAEVAFILTAKRHYNVPVPDAAIYLATILRMPGFVLPRGRKRRYLRALDLWAARPGLGFVDALTAAIVEHSDLRLATFDADFDGLPGITRWMPPNENGSA